MTKKSDDAVSCIQYPGCFSSAQRTGNASLIFDIGGKTNNTERQNAGLNQ